MIKHYNAGQATDAEKAFVDAFPFIALPALNQLNNAETALRTGLAHIQRFL